MANGELKKQYYLFDDFGYNVDSKSRVLSGFPKLDRFTKGFEMGCVTIWTGVSNVGKTTLLTMIARSAVEQNQKVFCFNGEQSKEDFKNNLFLQSSMAEDIFDVQYKDTGIYDSFVTEKRRYELAKKYGQNLLIYNNEAPRDIDSMLYAMKDAMVKYGVRVFILDNFMQIDMQSSDIFQEQSNVMEKLRTFAVINDVHIHLVAHPRKMTDFQVRLSLYDISGSMNLANKAYNIISIIRVDMMDEDSKEKKKLGEKLLQDGYNIEQTSTILEVLKTKGLGCGLVPLVFDKRTKSYKEQETMSSEARERLMRAKKKSKGEFV